MHMHMHMHYTHTHTHIQSHKDAAHDSPSTPKTQLSYLGIKEACCVLCGDGMPRAKGQTLQEVLGS